MAFGGQSGGVTHRYGIVLAATAAVVAVGIALPADHVGEGIALVLQALLLALITTASRDVASRVLTALAGAAAVLGVASAFGSLLPSWLTGAMGTLLAVTMAVTLARGVGRLLRMRGVTPQAVAGGLCLYILLGLLFAQAIGSVAGLGAPSTDYFAQGTDGTPSQRIYFSFMSLTTTGFGDLTPATDPGRAIAVLEMLIGQIYLVTVVALLVANVRRRPDGPRAPD